MQVRRFSRDLKTRTPGNHQGLFTVPIHYDATSVPEARREEFARRVNGLPILTARPLVIVAMFVEPHGMMEEHSGQMPTVFLVTSGRGFVRIGGPNGETREVTAGDAVLWPVGLEHTVWTEDEPLEAIAVEGPPEQE